MVDLDEAIQLTRQAVKAMPEDYQNRAEWLGHLENNLGMRYDERTGNAEDLEEAEAMHQRALAGYEKVLGEKHPDALIPMRNIALTLKVRRSRQGSEVINRQVL